MNLTLADVQAAQKELCKRSLSYFAQQAWHVLEPTTELKWGWALDAICEHLQAVTEGKITRLLINVPPGCMKSLLTSVIWPAWEWGPRGMQELRYIGTAHNADLAIRDTRKCRDLIKSEWYQQRWPIEIKRDQDGKTEFGNTRQGFRLAKAFTGMTGQRGDRVLLDDPIGAYDANSVAALEEARLAFTETLPTRINNETSVIVVIMQRLAENDTSGLIHSMGLPYVHLCIPMEYEAANDKGPNALGWKDPRTKDGELMFPERFSAQQVAELKLTLGPYGTAGQLQQSPSPRGGGIIKSEWFGEWQQLPPLEWLAITADTAQKTGQENDYSVLQLWGRSTTGQAVLVDQMRGKFEAPELLEKARSFWLKSKSQYPTLRGIYIEDKASGIGLVQTLRREGVPVLPIARNNGKNKVDKLSRANDAVPFIASGNVILPAYAGWVDGLLAEVERFPKGAHDDQLDPMFDAIQLVQMIPAQQNEWATAQLPNRRYVR